MFYKIVFLSWAGYYSAMWWRERRRSRQAHYFVSHLSPSSLSTSPSLASTCLLHFLYFSIVIPISLSWRKKSYCFPWDRHLVQLLQWVSAAWDTHILVPRFEPALLSIPAAWQCAHWQAEVMAQIIKFLPTTWDAQRKLLAPGFGLI